jgi:uncharacterized membrane protein YqaE (UPF0057 family)
MGKVKLFLAAVIILTGFYSCSTDNEFVRVKYLEKNNSKKHQIKHKPEKYQQEDYARNMPAEIISDKEIDNADAFNQSSKESSGVNTLQSDLSARKNNVPIGKKDVLEPERIESIEAEKTMEEVFVSVPAAKKVKKTSKLFGFLGLGQAPLILLVILAFLLPPLAVYLKRGIDTHFYISLVLTLLYLFAFVGIPYLVPIAIIHALLVVFDAI